MKIFQIIFFSVLILSTHAQNLEIRDLNNRIDDFNEEIKLYEEKIVSLKDSVAVLQKRIDSITFYSSLQTEKVIVTTINSSDIPLFRNPVGGRDIVRRLNLNEKIEVVDFTGLNLYKVRVGNDYGYISQRWVNENEDLLLMKTVRQREEKQRRKIEKEQKEAERIRMEEINAQQKKIEAEKKAEQVRLEREKYQKNRVKRLNEKYGSVVTQKILEKKIWLGMTSEMAIESWGKPKKINRTVTMWGTNEQWIYGEKYLYFDDGILTSWQD